MPDADSPTKKVLFRVIGETQDDVNVETLWAFDLGDDRYRLGNSPFYAYSVSAGDVVYAPFDPTQAAADLPVGAREIGQPRKERRARARTGRRNGRDTQGRNGGRRAKRISPRVAS
jgi:hypothetical protein